MPSVGATSFPGGFAATEHLLSLGHRRIAVVSGPPYKSTRARIAGYRTALQEAGVAPAPNLEKPGRFVTETGYEAARALLEAAPEPPTAIFRPSASTGPLRGGPAHPHDISVVGFDDLPLAGLLTPALTTVRQPVRRMGSLATRMLLRLIAGERLESTRVELATSLIVRESSAAPKP